MSYTVSARPTGGADYAALTGTVRSRRAGQRRRSTSAGSWTTAIVEGNETVIVTLTGTNTRRVTVARAGNTATVTIAGQRRHHGVARGQRRTAGETPTNPGQFTVTLAGGKVAPAGRRSR